jgi:hypothetical protein
MFVTLGATSTSLTQIYAWKEHLWEQAAGFRDGAGDDAASRQHEIERALCQDR